MYEGNKEIWDTTSPIHSWTDPFPSFDAFEQRPPLSYALLRSLFEAFVRAAWIQNCASDCEVDHFIEKDELKLPFGKMLCCIEENLDWGKTLTKLKSQTWKAMNSYTHGGLQIISQRFKDGYIEHDVNQMEIVELLKIVSTIAFLSFTQMVEISNSPEKKRDALAQILTDLSGILASGNTVQ